MESASSQPASGVIVKDMTETEGHFRMRKQVYEAALASGQTEEQAVVISSIFKNAYFMGCTYPEEVIQKSRTFWPREALDNPLYSHSE